MQIIIQNLAAEYGENRLFSDLNFSVRGGEFLQICGPNGCGKTTILRILAGLFPHYKGKVFLKNDGKQQKIAPFAHYLSIKNAMNEALTLKQNLKFWYDFYKSHLFFKQKQFDKLLEKWQLDHLIDAPFYTLSTGEKKRAAFIRILLTYRPIWLLDEPFCNLDTKIKLLITEHMRCHLNYGGLIILSTHQEIQNVTRIFNYHIIDLTEFSDS